MKRVDLNTLETELKEHDWTYEMSDDHSYWTSGTNQRSLIRAMVINLYEKGLGKKAEVLFYKYYPVDGCHEVKGYGIEKTWAEHLDRKAMETNKEMSIEEAEKITGPLSDWGTFSDDAYEQVVKEQKEFN